MIYLKTRLMFHTLFGGLHDTIEKNVFASVNTLVLGAGGGRYHVCHRHHWKWMVVYREQVRSRSEKCLRTGSPSRTIENPTRSSSIKAVRRIINVWHTPATEILVKRGRILKHPAHIRDTTHIPTTKISIKWGRFPEHIAHRRNTIMKMSHHTCQLWWSAPYKTNQML